MKDLQVSDFRRGKIVLQEGYRPACGVRFCRTAENRTFSAPRSMATNRASRQRVVLQQITTGIHDPLAAPPGRTANFQLLLDVFRQAFEGQHVDFRHVGA